MLLLSYSTIKKHFAMKKIKEIQTEKKAKNMEEPSTEGNEDNEEVGEEEDNGGYVSILEDTINKDNDLVEIDNFGKRGNRTDQLIDRMEEPEIKESLEEADIILITIGANDIMQIFKENFTDLDM